MQTTLLKKGTLAAIALATVAVTAWKAPERTVSAAPTTAAAPAGPTTGPSVAPVASYAPVVDRVMPAVVTLRVEKRLSATPTTDSQFPDDDLLRRFFGPNTPQMPRERQPRGVQRGLGSGVIVTQDGYILTNNHVVDEADEVRVELPDRRTFTARVVGTDPATDLAVLKINAGSLPTLALGDSDAVKVGDVVLAIGNPLGVGETVTSGIISAKGRTTDRGDSYQDFLQTDAPINHGNSGGALVSASGELIGINSQILSPSDGNIGLGFAIPSNMARNVMDQLIKNGTVRRAKLGVTVQGITADLASSLGLPSAKGALVSNVEDGSPAAHAGIRQGDVITEYNGKAIGDSNELRNDVASTAPGSTVSLKVFRDGRTETLQAKVGELAATRERSNSPSSERGEGKFGMGVQPLTPDLAERAGVPRGTQGVIVTDLDPYGVAADSGIQEGDVIEKVDGKTVKTVGELKSALERRDGKPSLVVVNRKGTDIFVTLRAE